MSRSAWFTGVLCVSLAVVLVFLTLPVVAIFVDRSPAEPVDALGEPGALDALWLSLRTTAASIAKSRSSSRRAAPANAVSICPSPR